MATQVACTVRTTLKFFIQHEDNDTISTQVGAGELCPCTNYFSARFDKSKFPKKKYKKFSV